MAAPTFDLGDVKRRMQGAISALKHDLGSLRTGRASPKLFLACAAGQHVPQTVLVAQRTGQSPLDFLAITLNDVTVTAYEAGDEGTAQDAPRDRVSLGFERIQLEYRPQQPDGSAGAPVRAGWNVKANRPA